MSNIFNEFYHGNLSPADKRMIKGSEMARAMKKLSDAVEVLERTIPPELRPVHAGRPRGHTARPRPPLPTSDLGGRRRIWKFMSSSRLADGLICLSEELS